MSGRLFAHYLDSVTRSAGHPERLRRSPSMRRGKRRGYLITASIVLAALILLSAGLYL